MDNMQRPPGRVSEALSNSTRASDVIDEAVQAEEDRPVRCAKFRQQELWAWKPVWSPRVIVIMYLIVALIFIPIGVVVLIQSTRLFSTARLRYDNHPNCDLGSVKPDPNLEKKCTIPIEIDKKVTPPAYVYYGMVNFYQNARTYVTSRSDTQNRGDENPDTSNCDPLEFNGTTLLDPCGLVANSQFNDTFKFCTSEACEEEEEINLIRKNIAWDIDREKRFKRSEAPSRSKEEDDRVISEPFMVWMRLAAYRNWKKLYGRIEEEIPVGTYYMDISARTPVGTFDGEKFFFISKTTWFGGPNEPLGIAYIAVGSAALILAIGIAVRARMSTTLDLPPETTVMLDGIVADEELPKPRVALGAESA